MHIHTHTHTQTETHTLVSLWHANRVDLNKSPPGLQLAAILCVCVQNCGTLWLCLYIEVTWSPPATPKMSTITTHHHPRVSAAPVMLRALYVCMGVCACLCSGINILRDWRHKQNFFFSVCQTNVLAGLCIFVGFVWCLAPYFLCFWLWADC